MEEEIMDEGSERPRERGRGRDEQPLGLKSSERKTSKALWSKGRGRHVSKVNAPDSAEEMRLFVLHVCERVCVYML